MVADMNILFSQYKKERWPIQSVPQYLSMLIAVPLVNWLRTSLVPCLSPLQTYCQLQHFTLSLKILNG